MAHRQRADAAALAYGLDKKKDETIAVFRLRGGTFDISISKSAKASSSESDHGATHLGGDNLDQRISSTGSSPSSRKAKASISARTGWRCSV